MFLNKPRKGFFLPKILKNKNLKNQKSKSKAFPQDGNWWGRNAGAFCNIAKSRGAKDFV